MTLLPDGDSVSRVAGRTDRMGERIMSETYVECLVKRKANPVKIFLRALTIMLAVVFRFPVCTGAFGGTADGGGCILRLYECGTGI